MELAATAAEELAATTAAADPTAEAAAADPTAEAAAEEAAADHGPPSLVPGHEALCRVMRDTMALYVDGDQLGEIDRVLPDRIVAELEGACTSHGYPLLCPGEVGRHRQRRFEYASGMMRRVRVVRRTACYFPHEHLNGRAKTDVEFEYTVCAPKAGDVVPVVAITANTNFSIKCAYYPYAQPGAPPLRFLTVIVPKELHTNERLAAAVAAGGDRAEESDDGASSAATATATAGARSSLGARYAAVKEAFDARQAAAEASGLDTAEHATMQRAVARVEDPHVVRVQLLGAKFSVGANKITAIGRLLVD
jgi:hypothetical protein